MKRLLLGAIDYGPYILLVLLPGGSVLALLVWLFRRHWRKGDAHVPNSQSGPARCLDAVLGAGPASRSRAG
jgi:hypothetical protein